MLFIAFLIQRSSDKHALFPRLELDLDRPAKTINFG